MKKEKKDRDIYIYYDINLRTKRKELKKWKCRYIYI